MKYTKEIIEEAVQNSVSVAGVLRFLGLKQAGGTHRNIVRRIQVYQIDTSHFTGQAHNTGKEAFNRKHWSLILVKNNNGLRLKALVLRQRLIETGREYKCVNCGNVGEWLGQLMTLEVDHIDGDFTNNVPTNLQFLCPNCHSIKVINKVGQTYL